MKIIIITETENGQEIQTFEKVTMIEYEDQTNIKNGRWLHIWQKNKNFAVEINKNDWFRIIK